MAIASFIQKRGFRKWYERELLRSHTHLVLLLLCAVAVLGALEAFSLRQSETRLQLAASLLTATALGIWAVRRYLFHLMRAETIANQAACPACKAYGRWNVEGDPPEEDGPGLSMAVRCRSCEQRWTIAC